MTKYRNSRKSVIKKLGEFNPYWDFSARGTWLQDVMEMLREKLPRSQKRRQIRLNRKSSL